jgi:hypothetical protein
MIRLAEWNALRRRRTAAVEKEKVPPISPKGCAAFIFTPAIYIHSDLKRTGSYAIHGTPGSMLAMYMQQIPCMHLYTDA